MICTHCGHAETLVSAPGIARRMNRTRQSVHMLINGTRGPGGFPAPVEPDLAVWRWSDVAQWAKANGVQPMPCRC